MKSKTTHKNQLDALKRIEGQIQGIRRMIEEEKYCIDIVIQLRAVAKALERVLEDVFAGHIDGCVRDAFEHGTARQKNKKIQEVLSVVRLRNKLT